MTNNNSAAKGARPAITEADVERHDKIAAYINTKRAERGEEPVNLTKPVTDAQLSSAIEGARQELLKSAWAMKKRYPADYKDFGRRIDDLSSWLVEHKHTNHVIHDELQKLYSELFNHPAGKEAKEAEADRKSKLSLFQQNHCLCIYGGRTVIRREDADEWILPDQARAFWAHCDVPGVDGKPQNVVTAFMEDMNTRRYDKVEFRPDKPGHYDGIFNLWQGWTVDPEEGNDDAGWWEVLEAACGYNPDYVEYVTKWFADIFQNPARKPGTAIGISGRQGIGKSALVETIGMLIANIKGSGTHRTIKGAYGDFTLDELLAEYNEHVANKLLVYLDEATWGGSHQEAQRMKKIITKDYETINPKFLGRITLDCYRREVFSSNNEFYYRPDKDDRRLLPLEYDTSKINEKTYEFWTKFYEARSKGKMLQNLLYHLQQVDLTGWEPQTALKQLRITTGKSMMSNTLQPWEHWLEEIATDGEMTVEVQGEYGKIESPMLIANQIIADENFENAFLLWARKHKCNTAWYSDAFRKERTKMLGEGERKMVDGRRFYQRHVPSCEEMLKRLHEGRRWEV